MPASTSLPVSTAPKKLSERRQRRAAEILAAAQACFLEKGFNGTAVSEIAQRANVAESLVFNYYNTKRDLLHAVLASMCEPLIRDMEEGYHRLRGLRPRLRFIIWRHLRMYLETSKMSMLLMGEVRSGPDYFASGLHDMLARYTRPLVNTLNEAIANGELASDLQIGMVRAAVYGTIEHLMSPVLFFQRAIDLEATTEQLTELMLNGMLAAGGRSHDARDGTPADTGIDARLQRIETLLLELHAAGQAE